MSKAERESVDRAEQLTEMAAIADLVARIESASNHRNACEVLAQQLQRYYSAAQAFVAVCRSGSVACRVIASSTMNSSGAGTSNSLAAQAVMQESLARGALARWLVGEAGNAAGLVVHQDYCHQHNLKLIVSTPLRDAAGRLQGALMLGFRENLPANTNVCRFLEAAEEPVASALGLIERAEQSTLRRSVGNALRIARKRKSVAVLLGLVVSIFLAAIPLTYHPDCGCTVEPVMRRYVAAPFDGALEVTHVEPGVEVKAGQLLALMDGREIRWELAGIRADLHRATKERAGFLATHDSGQAELARLEVERLQSRTELLEYRTEVLEVRSPIDGVIVSGDWKNSEGTTLQTGQTLYEVAPLELMVVELEIAEDDFAHVRSGMQVTIRFDAYPLRPFTSVVSCVHPRAELRDDENVFIAEVRLDNSNNLLRPGMKGSASIEGESHSLGWILLRRPFAAAIRWLGW
ncbi:MAG: efflux RND transporter periplasmic adaptor subunit [Pirellulales bacterium]|nr:efflux RND transporter periplasmic adaptor subunit [Pirellulales bacterium]